MHITERKRSMIHRYGYFEGMLYDTGHKIDDKEKYHHLLQITRDTYHQ